MQSTSLTYPRYDTRALNRGSIGDLGACEGQPMSSNVWPHIMSLCLAFGCVLQAGHKADTMCNGMIFAIAQQSIQER